WPFQGKTSVDVRHAVLHEEPQPLSEARPGETPARLQLIIDRALAKEPRQRYQKAAELRDDLRAALREIESGAAGFADSMALVAPRHLAGTGRMGRALRWLKNVTGERSS